jgi:hypothetical protein
MFVDDSVDLSRTAAIKGGLRTFAISSIALSGSLL